MLNGTVSRVEICVDGPMGGRSGRAVGAWVERQLSAPSHCP